MLSVINLLMCYRVEEDNPVLQAFNVFVQIMTSQAMEPGFLAALQEEKGENWSS